MYMGYRMILTAALLLANLEKKACRKTKNEQEKGKTRKFTEQMRDGKCQLQKCRAILI